MMMHSRHDGKAMMTVRNAKHAFEIIHPLTVKKPLQVYVVAAKNGGPREDSARLFA